MIELIEPNRRESDYDNCETSLESRRAERIVENDGSWGFYPNPASDHIRLAFSESEGRLRILNIAGQLLDIQEIDLPTKESLFYPTSHMSSGTYILEWTSSKKTSQTKTCKYVKIHIHNSNT